VKLNDAGTDLEFTKITDHKYYGSWDVTIAWQSIFDVELATAKYRMNVSSKECEALPSADAVTIAAGTTLAQSLVDDSKTWDNIDLSTAFTITSADKNCKFTYELTWDSDYNPDSDIKDNSVPTIAAYDYETATGGVIGAVTLGAGASGKSVDGIHTLTVKAVTT